MKGVCTCGEVHRSLTVLSRERYDPTRTTTLRNAFARELTGRFNKLIKVIRQAIVDDDCFGMAEGPAIFMASPGARAFAFPRSADKVEAFMRWLDTQAQSGILMVTKVPGLAGTEGTWDNLIVDSQFQRYLREAYSQGAMRARTEMTKAGVPGIPGMSELGGVDAVLSHPFHADRLGLIYTRAYGDLKGITTTMEGQISRVLAQGMAEGRGPRELARMLQQTVGGGGGDLGITDTLGRFIPAKRRAEILARTEVIRAHHLATIQEYRNWGQEGVRVQAEWKTAGDGRVCDECASLEGQVYTLDEIESMIPVHPQCRCIALPLDVTDVKEKGPEEQLSQDELQDEIAKDPVASRYSREDAMEYLGYKREATDFFEDLYSQDQYKGVFLSVREGRNLTAMDHLFGRQTEVAFHKLLQKYYMNTCPTAFRAIENWQTGTGGHGPMSLKRWASILEGKNYTMRYPVDMSSHFHTILKNLGTLSTEDIRALGAGYQDIVPKSEYLRLRAINQAFLEVAGVKEQTLYRGIGGRSGEALALSIKKATEAMEQGELHRTKWTVKETALTGYTSDVGMAQRFANGTYYEKTVKSSDVVVDRNLMGLVTSRYLLENESILLTGTFDISLGNVTVTL